MRRGHRGADVTHLRQDPARICRRQSSLGQTGAGVFCHHAELHRPRGAGHQAADAGQGDELDGAGLKNYFNPEQHPSVIRTELDYIQGQAEPVVGLPWLR
jgi:hypothetical protein